MWGMVDLYSISLQILLAAAVIAIGLWMSRKRVVK